MAGAFTPMVAGGATLSVTATSNSATLGTAGDAVWVCNVGSDDCFVELGPAAVVVVKDTGFCVPTDREVFLRRNPDTDVNLAAICDTGGTCTLKICTGDLDR